jgi:hypothetical protein
MRVAGVALGRFALTDGRRADKPRDAAEMVAHFVPDTVPLVFGHGGVLLGYLDSLAAEGADLHFTGTVGGWPDLPDVLRDGRAVSIETVYGAAPLPDGGRYPDELAEPAVSYSYFVGSVRVGLNLVGIAVLLTGQRPAARGSVVWIADE